MLAVRQIMQYSHANQSGVMSSALASGAGMGIRNVFKTNIFPSVELLMSRPRVTQRRVPADQLTPDQCSPICSHDAPSPAPHPRPPKLELSSPAEWSGHSEMG